MIDLLAVNFFIAALRLQRLSLLLCLTQTTFECDIPSLLRFLTREKHEETGNFEWVGYFVAVLKCIFKCLRWGFSATVLQNSHKILNIHVHLSSCNKLMFAKASVVLFSIIYTICCPYVNKLTVFDWKSFCLKKIFCQLKFYFEQFKTNLEKVESYKSFTYRFSKLKSFRKLSENLYCLNDRLNVSTFNLHSVWHLIFNHESPLLSTQLL